MWAWLFPGQGAQAVGMGRALFDSSPAAREIYERADASLKWPLSRLCFEGPEAELGLTANTQPAILTTSLAALAALREAVPDLPKPTLAAGHSLGEYSALAALGAISLEDAVRVVHLRGKAMQQAVPAGEGSMAAVMGASPEEVVHLCADAAGSEVLAPANFNAPGQVVISGHSKAVERARGLAAERGFKAIPLKVSAPFHCGLMAPAAKAVQEALANVSLHAPSCPVVSNFEARPNSDGGRVADLLVRQVDGAVRWEESIRVLSASGVNRALELGPGNVLSGLVRKIDKQIAVTSVSSPEQIAKVAELLA